MEVIENILRYLKNKNLKSTFIFHPYANFNNCPYLKTVLCDLFPVFCFGRVHHIVLIQKEAFHDFRLLDNLVSFYNAAFSFFSDA